MVEILFQVIGPSVPRVNPLAALYVVSGSVCEGCIARGLGSMENTYLGLGEREKCRHIDGRASGRLVWWPCPVIENNVFSFKFTLQSYSDVARNLTKIGSQ